MSSGTQLKVRFRTPDRVPTGALLPFRRVRDMMKKHRHMTPRMIMPEMSAMVIVFV